jgi:hypothetical protein
LLGIGVALWIFQMPEVPGTLGTIIHHYNPLAIPAVFFGLYVLWHMAKTRHWGWLFASLVLAPFTFLVYYWRIVRIQFAPHGAQQGAPGDAPRPAGEPGG